MWSLLLRLKKAGHYAQLIWGAITLVIVPLVALLWRRTSSKVKQKSKNGTSVVDVSGEVINEK
ncbi:hypothetical protein KBC55_02255 [Patescibacteria group bacterium]|nr:hypothetical protein [Patescibacteria group bacterium]